jgi:hypothetical protein
MRINYSEDEDFPGQFNLWQANCQRSINGKAGQKALRELEQALVALPDKRLIAGELQTADGEVCAIGALLKYRGIEKTEADPEEMEEVGIELGLPPLVAWKVVCQNDIEIDGRYLEVFGPHHPTYRFAGRDMRLVSVTPGERYEKMLAWVRKQIQEATP